MIDNVDTSNMDLIKVAEKNDYTSAYLDYVDFEESYEDEEISSEIVDFVTFCAELSKGYGNSKILQIARLVQLEDGIYYDNDFVA